MKKLFYFLSLMLLFSLSSYSQDPVNLTFTSTFASQSVHPEYITVSNLIHGGDTTLYWPDTVLTIIPVGSSALPVKESSFRLFQNVPNPVTGSSETTFKVYIPHEGYLQISVTDVTGRTVASLNMPQNTGYSTFRLTTGKSRIYIVNAIFEGLHQSIKIVSASNNHSSSCSLKYLGTETVNQSLKSTETRSNFVYYTGDSLSMTAKYLQFESTIIDIPLENEVYFYDFSEILSGADSKDWKLLRDASSGRYPLQVGPADGSTIWWALGYSEAMWVRLCMFNDVWTFTSDGDMLYRTQDDYWAEGGIFHPDLEYACHSTDSMYGPGNEDFSAWGDGDHLYSISEENVTVNGLGAFIGFLRTGTDAQVTVPQEQIIYSLSKLSESTTDTLIVQCNYITADNIPAYWRYVLVHYDNPQDEPPMPYENPPMASFDIIQEGMTVFVENTTPQFVETVLWDFGDGQYSNQHNAVHTYAAPGKYIITLTVSNSLGSSTVNRIVIASEVSITNELLIGNSWKVSIGEETVFVGPALGSSTWWSVPPAEMLPGQPWSCLANDEFIFSEGGNYEYLTNGDARNDGYMGYNTIGCITDTELLASGNGAAFQSATHTYELFPGYNPHIIFTNGSPTTAAFIGYYKGYYGGENSFPEDLPNGGITTNRYEVLGYYDDGVKEYLLISVDLNGTAPKGPAWSYILERNIVK